jgi:hypothetical protein
MNWKKLKTLEDFQTLRPPEPVEVASGFDGLKNQNVLRMLVRPKYGWWQIPIPLIPLRQTIFDLAKLDLADTGIEDSWCYATIRKGEVSTKTDDEWHFDGASFRTSIIPERNYVWTSHTPTEYVLGTLHFPKDFDPVRHDLFSFAYQTAMNKRQHTCDVKQWYRLSPFCLHRRPTEAKGQRTFLRICFTDIEGRDVNNTPNPLLPTDAFGRDPVRSFRDKLQNYLSQPEQ